jgi:uncharacterized membrane protein YgdD (TMEM256/DUF423 family)
MPRLFAIAAAIALIVCGIAGAVAVIVTQRTQQTQRMAMVEAAADDIFLEQVYWRAVSDGKDYRATIWMRECVNQDKKL